MSHHRSCWVEVGVSVKHHSDISMSSFHRYWHSSAVVLQVTSHMSHVPCHVSYYKSYHNFTSHVIAWYAIKWQSTANQKPSCYFTSFISPLPFYLFPATKQPPKPAVGCGESCKLPSDIWGEAPTNTDFGALWEWKNSFDVKYYVDLFYTQKMSHSQLL